MDDIKISRFWDNFIEKSKNYGVKPDAARWYVKHAERYIKAHQSSRLSEHTPQFIDTYLADQSRQPRLHDWQFKQIIKSLQIMFVELVKPDWAASYPWTDRIAEAITLPADHATLARDHGYLAKNASPPSAPEPITNSDSLLKKVSAAFPHHFERLITEIRMRHYSIRTEKTYTEWLARFIHFNSLNDPATMEPDTIAKYLEHLVVNRNVASSTQSQALNALLFFYKQVLGNEVGDIGLFRHATKPRKLPVVLTRDEVIRLLQQINNPERQLMVNLLYGCGMRLMECVRLRVLDVDFGYQQIIVRNAKGGKDRVVPLPNKLIAPLQEQIAKSQQIHQADIAPPATIEWE